MRRKTFWRIVVASLIGGLSAIGATGTAAVPAGAQEGPPAETGTMTVNVGFGGLCTPVNVPGGIRLGSGSATLTVPTSVEQGETFPIAVGSIGGPPAETDPSFYLASFGAAGADPAGFGSTGIVSSGAPASFSGAELTATGPAGSDIVISLNAVSVRWFLPQLPDRQLGLDCSPGGDIPPDIPVDPVVTARIPIVAPTCLGEAATIVGAADRTVVAGTPGDDVIVASAPGVTVTPGGGHDLVCARAGDATLSFAGVGSATFASLADGIGRARGSTVRFEGFVGLQGSSRTDVLVGDDAGNVLRGGDGSDLLIGGAGADTLDGQGGRDILVGDGDDTCVSGIALGCPVL
jgi:hypothetical protein